MVDADSEADVHPFFPSPSGWDGGGVPTPIHTEGQPEASDGGEGCPQRPEGHGGVGGSPRVESGKPVEASTGVEVHGSVRRKCDVDSGTTVGEDAGAGKDNELEVNLLKRIEPPARFAARDMTQCGYEVTRRTQSLLPAYACFSTLRGVMDVAGTEAPLREWGRSSACGLEPRNADKRRKERALFAVSAIETLKPEILKQWLSLEHWATVEVIVDIRAFQERVLGGDAQAGTGDHVKVEDEEKTSRISRLHREDLCAKGYLRRIHSAYMCCTIFSVWKSDGVSLRLIWNGVPFNARCKRPPPFTITNYRDMLAKLLAPEVYAYICFDFQTWFAQIAPHREVARYFATKIGRTVWGLTGIPMGWSWACVIAQYLTQAFARAVLSRLKLERSEVVVEFCIDNTIIAFRRIQGRPAVSSEELLEVMRVVQTVADEMNIRIKASATEIGERVEWLPYVLDAGSKRAHFKTSFKEKLEACRSEAQVRAQRGAPCALIEVWRTVGLVLFALYAAMLPLSRLRNSIRWMASVARSVESDREWLTQTRSFEYWEEVRSAADAAAQTAEEGIRPPPLREDVETKIRAWFVSDAATSGNCSFVSFSPEQVTVRSWTAPLGARIETLELEAHLRALSHVMQQAEGPGLFLGYGDNVVALAAQRRGYSMIAPTHLAAQVEVCAEALRSRGQMLLAPYVESKACLADVWTRRAEPVDRTFPACVSCPYVPGAPCECTLRQLRTLAKDEGLWDRTCEAWKERERYRTHGCLSEGSSRWSWWQEAPEFEMRPLSMAGEATSRRVDYEEDETLGNARPDPGVTPGAGGPPACVR